MSALELWGGIECTVNRVGDAWNDQLELNGPAGRLESLDLVAALGVRALRYPVLWERTSPDSPARRDWRWPDPRLARLRELGIRPIVGLVHHGSGPRYTSLVERSFATGLEVHARAVAERYPWIDAYTPVNEPMTTARFAALYGHWYPHARDEGTWLEALLNECRGTVLAMRAIRGVNSAARLVQTDDLGRIYATPRVQYQADYENERRWLAWDLLCGRVDERHPLWKRLKKSATVRDLLWFAENPCPPDVIGINHYLTSDRFLHEEPELFPAHCRGGNGVDRYADVEAVRVLDPPSDGFAQALREAWERYRLPLAVTEAHLGSTREEQLRWLHEVWRIAKDARAAGADVRAVTVWALFGSYDWNSLVTDVRGYYEPGAFDVRGGEPRPTALAGLIRELADGREGEDPCLSGQGWWRRDDRLRHALSEEARARGRELARGVPIDSPARRRPARPLLITGATGTLGRAFARICEERGLSYRLLSRGEMDIVEPESVARVLGDLQPWALVNTAGYVRVDEAERDCERCWRENAVGPGVLADACARTGVRLLTFSSDLVFDGAALRPYVESDPVAPLNVYGRSKARAETAVLERWPSALVVRTSAFFGPWDEHNFVHHALRTLGRRERFEASDAVVSPTYVPDLVGACLDLLVDGESGLWHLANQGGVSWSEFARRAAVLSGTPCGTLVTVPQGGLALPAPRPAFSVLSSERGLLLPTLQDALERYVVAAA